MEEYHKINTVYKRDTSNNNRIIEGSFSISEFEYLANNPWLFSEKIDGTNIRIMLKDGSLTFGGRTNNANNPGYLLERLNDIFNLDSLFSVFPKGNVCLYGEGYGAGIRKGGSYIPDGCDFILFDVWCGGWWLERNNVEDVSSKLGIKVVPLIGEGTLYEGIELVREGFKSRIGACIAEGLVMKPKVCLFGRGGRRIVAKIKYRDFLH